MLVLHPVAQLLFLSEQLSLQVQTSQASHLFISVGHGCAVPLLAGVGMWEAINTSGRNSNLGPCWDRSIKGGMKESKSTSLTFSGSCMHSTKMFWVGAGCGRSRCTVTQIKKVPSPPRVVSLWADENRQVPKWSLQGAPRSGLAHFVKGP